MHFLISKCSFSCSFIII